MGASLISNCASFMQFSFRYDVGVISLFRRVECPKVHTLSVFSDNSPPSIAVTTCPKNAAAFVGEWGFASVLCVPFVRYIAQVVNAVIGRITIFVVNLIDRPNTIDVQPRQAVRLVSFAINPYPNATALINSTGIFATMLTSGSNKDAGVWIVVKQLAQSLRGKIRLSHDAVPLLIGQKPGRVISACSASSF